MNLLFYSNNCKTCYRLLNILKQDNFLGLFKLINVDEYIATNRPLPKEITKVPTMVITSNKQILVEAQTFEYINTLKFFRYKDTHSSEKKQETSEETTKTNDPFPYLKTEMAGFSDTFTFLDTDNPLQHTFLNYGEENKHAIYTAPEQSKLSKETLAHRHNKLQVERRKM